jgi:hypothetical protein
MVALVADPTDSTLTPCCMDRRCGALSPTRVPGHAMRTYSGRPSSSIRFSTSAAMATSLACCPSVCERSPSPMTRFQPPCCIDRPLGAASGRIKPGRGPSNPAGALLLLFKASQDRRHHIPKQKHRVTNWAEPDAPEGFFPGGWRRQCAGCDQSCERSLG